MQIYIRIWKFENYWATLFPKKPNALNKDKALKVPRMYVFHKRANSPTATPSILLDRRLPLTSRFVSYSKSLSSPDKLLVHVWQLPPLLNISYTGSPHSIPLKKGSSSWGYLHANITVENVEILDGPVFSKSTSILPLLDSLPHHTPIYMPTLFHIVPFWSIFISVDAPWDTQQRVHNFFRQLQW